MQIPLSAGIRQNRSKRYMTVVWCILLAFLLSAGGCSLVKIEEGERTPLEYTVVDTAELPQSRDRNLRNTMLYLSLSLLLTSDLSVFPM